MRLGGEPYKGEWAFPGGFLHMDETAEEGALRELREETGLTPSAVGQLGVFSEVDRDPREEKAEPDDIELSIRGAETEDFCSLAAPCMVQDFYGEAESFPMPTSSREEHPRKGRPGRIDSLFRLNRKRYEEMKEDGGKMEF